MRSSLLRSCTFAIVWACLCGGRAHAHDETVSTSEVTIEDRTVVWKVDVGLTALARAGRLPMPEDQMGERELEGAKAEIARYLQAALSMELDGTAAAAEVGALEPRYEPSTTTGKATLARVVLELRYASERPIQVVRAKIAFFADLTSAHRALIVIRWGEHVQQLARLGVADIEVARWRPAPGDLATFREFAIWGAEHIFIGFDHIAFLLVLLLASTRLREVIQIVTAFTVAHSLTLLLAALGVLQVPSRLTEALIAASIVYVAVENLARGGGRHRWALTFAFGLIHGLGFAGVLQERIEGLQGQALILPIVSFNVGVELGQLVIVALVFPVFGWLRRGHDETLRRMRQRRLVRVGSVPALLLGLYWLVERSLGG